MKSKFSRPTFIKPGFRYRWLSLLAIIPGVLGLSSTLHAQSPTPHPSEPPKAKQAYVRFWNMLPAKSNDVLELVAGENTALTTAMPENFYGAYGPVTPGTANLMVRRVNDPKNPLKRLPVQLLADSYVTILVSLKDGQPVVEAIDDTVDPKTAVAGRLIVRQYVAGAKVTTIVGAASTGPLNYGETAVLDGLPNTPLVVNVQATLASGPPRTWTVPADFSSARHATMLFVTDPYGHFRPRISVDGAMTGPPMDTKR